MIASILTAIEIAIGVLAEALLPGGVVPLWYQEEVASLHLKMERPKRMD